MFPEGQGRNGGKRFDVDGRAGLCFHLAETLGMTVYELKSRMTLDELSQWSEWFEWKAKKNEEAEKKAKAEHGRKPRPSNVKPAGRRQ